MVGATQVPPDGLLEGTSSSLGPRNPSFEKWFSHTLAHLLAKLETDSEGAGAGLSSPSLRASRSGVLARPYVSRH